MGWLKAYTVAIVSLLSGAAVVHNIFKPDLVRSRCTNRNESVSKAYQGSTMRATAVNDPDDVRACTCTESKYIALQTIPVSHKTATGGTAAQPAAAEPDSFAK